MLITLYENAIQLAGHAIASIENRLDDVGETLDKMLTIISELDAAVDTSAGTEAAENLHGLYEFVRTRLLEIKAHPDAEMLREVAGLLQELNQSFKIICC
jgi:flagellar protein FliS